PSAGKGARMPRSPRKRVAGTQSPIRIKVSASGRVVVTGRWTERDVAADPDRFYNRAMTAIRGLETLVRDAARKQRDLATEVEERGKGKPADPSIAGSRAAAALSPPPRGASGPLASMAPSES